MKIDLKHPIFVDFLRCEHKTLTFLRDYPYVGASLKSLYVSAKKALELFPSLKDQHLKKFSFRFDTCLDVIIEKKILKLVIECQVTPEFDLVNYVVSICDESDDGFIIMRKFHFDYAPLSINDIEKKPIYHFQYGGQASPALNKMKVEVKSIFPYLSSPRLFHYPVNLAILLDMVFVEFKSELTEKLVKSNPWKNLIKENEVELLVPYIKNINSFITSGKHNPDLLIRDFYYGKTL